MKTGFIIRFHYEENDKRFPWRLDFFKNEVLPRIKNQTFKDFDICIGCNQWQVKIFQELGLKTFTADWPVRYKNNRFFHDFVKFEDLQGLEKYDVQFGLDSDDLIEENYVQTAMLEIQNHIRLHRSSSFHLSYQPKLFRWKDRRIERMNKYNVQRGSAFMCLYQPITENNYRFIYEESHITIIKKAVYKKIIPEGFCYAVAHDLNESTGKNQVDSKKLNCFWHQAKNVGDTLTPVIIDFFGMKANLVDRNHNKKIISVGSIMTAMREKDIIFGTGIMFEKQRFPLAKTCKILALRGKLTRDILKVNCEVFGDPAILLPRIYNQI